MIIRVYVTCCGGDKAVDAVNEAVKQAGVKAQVEIVKDLQVMVKDGVMSTPTIAVAGKIVATGRVPKVPDLVKWIEEAAVKTA